MHFIPRWGQHQACNHCHSERSGAKLRNPAATRLGSATGCLDFARHDEGYKIENRSGYPGISGRKTHRRHCASNPRAAGSRSRWLGAGNPSDSGQDRQITWVILLDSDGQHLPEEIDRFLLAAASVTRPTFFIGNRMGDVARMPFVRRVVNRYMSNQISRVCGQKIPDTQCGYRMLHRELIPDVLGGGHRYDYETEALIIASRKGYRIESVPITTVYTDQVSKIHPGRDSLRFFKMMRRYRNGR
jgi:hypothetical protein